MDSVDVVRRRRRIVVDGPLAGLADGLRAELAGQGYAQDTVTDHVHLLADLSLWLHGQGLAAADLTTQVAQEFLRARRAGGCRIGVTGRAIAPLLGYLRRLQVIPPHRAASAVTPLETLLAEYRRYLGDERGLSAGTVNHYVRYARTFLGSLPDPVITATANLLAGRVTGYVLAWTAARRGRAPDMVMLPALRSLLRFLQSAGYTAQLLTAAVPAGRGRPRNAGLPRAASGDHIQAVLARCDRDSAGGCRDYAILLTMARLALRGGEVARLTLTDVNWHAGELLVRGKGGRTDVLPLPVDVGHAMADYVMRARPSTRSPNLFVTLVAPFAGMATSSVTMMVARACQRAGVARFGPHGMRHAAACDLLAAGASMEEIGQLLRHAQERTTAIYAKVDQARLAELAMPCPREHHDEHPGQG